MDEIVESRIVPTTDVRTAFMIPIVVAILTVLDTLVIPGVPTLTQFTEINQ